MAFTGNGLLGAMVTAGNTTGRDIGSIRIELGRTDVTDDRMPNSPLATGETTKCDRNRLPIGYFQLATKGRVVVRVDAYLYDAVVAGSVTTTEGIVNFTVLTHATRNIHAVNSVGTNGERDGSTWVWNPRQGNSPWTDTVCLKYKKDYVGNPLQIGGADNRAGIKFTVQPLHSGASYATAYAKRTEPDGSQTLIASTAGPQ
eukprot:CAMPEP_0206292158 /NCGR_PEP_ID=MMETSP0106_2-20121207/3486_1 /ASSEMBLY_ACC=CAM_ASM_000206 /TAXON_ID=81532 /ORGANISM="Acanthoeca-like sp., Strain 10tr" /LENGTH=200 /DNA_ID=CAMNT_0053722731 /DNA_START=10 /DNA_END=608 /DNA_ORIENTATION=+